jgi:hypothetical protein
MAQLISKGWKAMNQSQQIKFIHTTKKASDVRPKLVRSIQGAALVASSQVRETLVPIFYHMIECEVAESTSKTPDRVNFDVMEREVGRVAPCAMCPVPCALCTVHCALALHVYLLLT